jgi:hypothetical protein
VNTVSTPYTQRNNNHKKVFVCIQSVKSKKQIIKAIDTLPISPAKQRALRLALKYEKINNADNNDMKNKFGTILLT